MVKKVNDKKNPVGTVLTVPALAVVLYMTARFLLPEAEDVIRKLIIAVLLVTASVHDIFVKKIPVYVCIAILFINVIYSLTDCFIPASWVFSAVSFLLLIAVYFINRDLIGLGDILLLTVCIQSMSPVGIMKFLFLAFTFSFLLGVLKCIRKGSMKKVSVPMAPCIASAFLLLAW